MSAPADIPTLFEQFLTAYDANKGDRVWQGLSDRFREFWSVRVLSDDPSPISDVDCDEVIRILDRNGKGNTKDSEAVAKAMVPQGAWRRMLNEFHISKELGRLVHSVLVEEAQDRKAVLIDKLYELNAGRRNNLTGPSGNTVGAFLAAYDPFNNLSVISLKDRHAIMAYLNLAPTFDWEATSIGKRMVETNRMILEWGRSLRPEVSARTITRFFYSSPVKGLWKGEHTIKRADKNISVTVPTVLPEEEESAPDVDSIRESMQIQALLARIGTMMGFTIWLPKADRGRVLKAWKAEPGDLLDELPLGYDSTTTKTIEQIDVLWLKKRSIVRAFEVEHTTSVYSGLLRMADLVALQPNINIKLHIVAPAEKREKVLQEIQRPVFSLLEGRALSEMCTYLSYDSIKEIGDLRHLEHVSDKVIEDYEETAE